MNKRFSFQKVAPALGVVCISLGGLLWQLDSYRARVQAAQAAEAAKQIRLNPSLVDYHEAHKSLRLAVAATVRGHLAALRRDDYGAATAFFAHDLRQKFAEPNSLRDTMQASQSPFTRFKTLKFTFVNTDVNTYPWHQKSNAGVRVTDAGGVAVDAVFHLQLENGVWRIGGVTTMKPPAPAKNS